MIDQPHHLMFIPGNGQDAKICGSSLLAQDEGQFVRRPRIASRVKFLCKQLDEIQVELKAAVFGSTEKFQCAKVAMADNKRFFLQIIKPRASRDGIPLGEWPPTLPSPGDFMGWSNGFGTVTAGLIVRPGRDHEAGRCSGGIVPEAASLPGLATVKIGSAPQP